MGYVGQLRCTVKSPNVWSCYEDRKQTQEYAWNSWNKKQQIMKYIYIHTTIFWYHMEQKQHSLNQLRSWWKNYITSWDNRKSCLSPFCQLGPLGTCSQKKTWIGWDPTAKILLRFDVVDKWTLHIKMPFQTLSFCIILCISWACMLKKPPESLTMNKICTGCKHQRTELPNDSSQLLRPQRLQ